MDAVKIIKSLKQGWDNFVSDKRGEIEGIMIVVLAIVVGAILTGAVGPTSLGLIVNGTAVGGALYNAPASTTQTWNSIPVLYAVAFLVVPIAAVVKYMKM